MPRSPDRRPPWTAWLLWSLWVVLLSATTTLAVLIVWERRNPCPCPVGVAGPMALPTLPVTPTVPAFPYIAQEGQTLAQIAEQMGVPLEELQALNDLPADQPLPQGQLLFIPGTPPATVTQGRQVRIVDVLAPGLLEQERVRLTNLGYRPVFLEGWTLSDLEGRAVFRFPAVWLYAQGSLFVWSREGTNTAVDLYWGRTQPAWQPGDWLVLRDAQGQEVDRFEVPR